MHEASSSFWLVRSRNLLINKILNSPFLECGIAYLCESLLFFLSLTVLKMIYLHMFMAKRTGGKKKTNKFGSVCRKWIRIFLSSALKGKEPVIVSSSGKDILLSYLYPPIAADLTSGKKKKSIFGCPFICLAFLGAMAWRGATCLGPSIPGTKARTPGGGVAPSFPSQGLAAGHLLPSWVVVRGPLLKRRLGVWG